MRVVRVEAVFVGDREPSKGHECLRCCARYRSDNLFQALIYYGNHVVASAALVAVGPAGLFTL